MAKDTPSIAKNKIKRCLNAILDPHPESSDVDHIWKYFESSCAYCGVLIDRNSRQGHLDHAIPASRGGTNSIYSHVLACGRCNGDEKREEAWETFLAKKCASTDILNQRRTRIIQWLSMTDSGTRSKNEDIRLRAQAIIESAIASFDRSVSEMKCLRDDS